jgi:DNA-binding LacI/PurR family transcriptional regulator
MSVDDKDIPARRRRPTVRDVAAGAGVSAQTVSNYINHRYNEMSVDTRGRIAAVMEEVGFHPDSTARNLRSKRTRAFVFLIVDESQRFLADPMTDLILAGIGDVARGTGYSLLIQAGTPGAPSADLLAPLFERRADAAFLFLSGDPTDRSWYASRLADEGIPCVIFDEEHPAETVFSVTAANRDGAHRLVGHLIDRGHKRIAFIAARVSWPMIEQRHFGYRDALQEAGIALDPDLERFDGVWDLATGGPIVEALLAMPDAPTAIVCANDLLALGAVHQIRSQGMDVPRDVAVVGFNDFDFSGFIDPPLTTVRIPGYELGRIAAERLVTYLESGSGNSAESHHVQLPVELVLRSSS